MNNHSEMRIVFIGSVGGHLAALYEVASRVSENYEQHFVTFFRPKRTFDNKHHFMVDPRRSAVKLLINFLQSLVLFYKLRPKIVISSGAGFVVPFVLIARLLGSKVLHFELACQLYEPSKTGRILRNLGIQCFGQSESLSYHGFKFVLNPFDNFVSEELKVSRKINRIFVALGNAPERLSRINLVLQCIKDLFPEALIFGQVGTTEILPEFGLSLPSYVNRDELLNGLQTADLVVAHGGVGIILETLRAGTPVVVIPRLPELGEHTDITQLPLGKMISKHGLGVCLEGMITHRDVKDAFEYCCSHRIVQRSCADFGQEFVKEVF